MDPRSTLEPSPFSHYSARSSSYTEQNNSAPQLQASFFSCNTQSNGTGVSVIAPGSLHDPRYHASDYSSIPRPVQSMPNYQLDLCGPPNPHTRLPLEDLSFTHRQLPDSSSKDHRANGVDAIHAAPTWWGHQKAVSWEDTNPQMDSELIVIENHNPLSLSQNIHEVSSSSDLLESSPPMIADDFSSPYVGSYTPSEVQDDYTDAISSPPGGARSTTSPVETQWHDAAAQEASQHGQQPSTKKSRDKERKRVQRSEDVQHFTKICTLLKIPPSPKKTLAYRINVEALVERQERDSDLRYRLEESEAEVAILRKDLARVSAERTTGSRLAIKANTALGGVNTGETRQSWP